MDDDVNVEVFVVLVRDLGCTFFNLLLFINRIVWKFVNAEGDNIMCWHIRVP